MANNVKTSPPQDLELGWAMNRETYASVVGGQLRRNDTPFTHIDGDNNHQEPFRWRGRAWVSKWTCICLCNQSSVQKRWHIISFACCMGMNDMTILLAYTTWPQRGKHSAAEKLANESFILFKYSIPCCIKNGFLNQWASDSQNSLYNMDGNQRFTMIWLQ